MGKYTDSGIPFGKAVKAYEEQMTAGKVINDARVESMVKTGKLGDSRYNTPKEDPKANDTQVEETIESTEIYKRAKELILKAQHKQVAYGIDKYPEPLNADTWTMIETMRHIIEESIDKLHYEVMLLVKLEREAENELKRLKGKDNDIFYMDNKPYFFDPEYGFVPIEGKEYEERVMIDDGKPKPLRVGNTVEVHNRDLDGNITVNITVNGRDDDSIDALSYAVSEMLRLNNKR
jgi:hypothetical protein